MAQTDRTIILFSELRLNPEFDLVTVIMRSSLYLPLVKDGQFQNSPQSEIPDPVVSRCDHECQLTGCHVSDHHCKRSINLQ